MESRIQRSGLHLKHISGLQTQSMDNAISMLWSPLQRLQNEHVECSLQQLNSVFILVFLVHRCRHSTRTAVDCLHLYYGGAQFKALPSNSSDDTGTRPDVPVEDRRSCGENARQQTDLYGDFVFLALSM